MPKRRGKPVLVTQDEGVRGDTTAEALARLRPAFAPNGTITAGSASQISDGAAAVVVMSRVKANELSLPVLAEIGHHGFVAGPDASLLSQPANAIAAALRKEGLTPADVNLYEINEAFAAVAKEKLSYCAFQRELGVGLPLRRAGRPADPLPAAAAQPGRTLPAHRAGPFHPAARHRPTAPEPDDEILRIKGQVPAPSSHQRRSG